MAVMMIKNCMHGAEEVSDFSTFFAISIFIDEFSPYRPILWVCLAIGVTHISRNSSVAKIGQKYIRQLSPSVNAILVHTSYFHGQLILGQFPWQLSSYNYNIITIILLLCQIMITPKIKNLIFEFYQSENALVCMLNAWVPRFLHAHPHIYTALNRLLKAWLSSVY